MSKIKVPKIKDSGPRKLHLTQIETRLGQLWYEGTTDFKRWELCTWFNLDRVTKTIWQEIFHIWSSYFEGEPDEIIVIANGDPRYPDHYTLFHTGLNFKRLTNQGWEEITLDIDAPKPTMSLGE